MMKKLSACIALAVLFAVVHPASAVVCLELVSFCDSFELEARDGRIIGDWVSYNCDGDRAPLDGPLFGGTGGTAQVLCGSDGCDTCVVTPGFNWGFIIDSLDGTMDMYRDEFGGCEQFEIWIDELEYTTSMGPCDERPHSPYGPAIMGLASE